MALQLQNFTTLVQNMAAAVQSSASALINFKTGSVLRAIQEANASVALWLQWLILQVLSLTRLATSIGTDVDSWVADFGLIRLPAIASSGLVTFARYSTAVAGFVPVGAQVKTSDGTRIYQVIADTTNAAWNGSTGFTIPSGVTSINCTVTDITTDTTGALSIGTAGNVVASTITLAASAMPSVDFVNNATPFTNGIDAESDTALRSRFSNYVQTRSKGTSAAIDYAISSVQQGLNWTKAENVNAAGVYTPGSFVVTVDDGTGNPPTSLLNAVSAAIAAYRPIGSVWTVAQPASILATINLTITTTPATNKPSLLTPVENAILAYVNTLPDGAMLPYSRLAMVAYMVDPSITDVTAVTLNGGTADIVPTLSQVIKATTASVTVT